MPIALPRIVDGVHHKGIDVGDSQAIFLESSADGLFLLLEQEGRPGMWYIGHDLDTLVADGGQTLYCLGERIFQIRIGAKSELHVGCLSTKLPGRQERHAETREKRIKVKRRKCFDFYFSLFFSWHPWRPGSSTLCDILFDILFKHGELFEEIMLLHAHRVFEEAGQVP